MTADLAVFLSNVSNVHVDAFGVVGLGLGFAAGAMPNRTAILIASAACSACFGLHFLHLGASTGAAMCTVSVVQGLVSALCLGTRGRGLIAPVFALTSLVAVWLTLATWNGWPSGFAAVGAILSTSARLQGEARPMRLLFLAASLCWAGHNLLVGSVFAMTCDLVTMSGLVLALRRARLVRPASAPGGLAA